MTAIQPVPPIDPQLPDFPGPNTPEAQYDDTAYKWGSAIPGFGDDLKALGDNVYNNATAAKEQADAAIVARDRAETATTNALSAMNFKGDWSTLSGPLTRPATVQHSNSVWLLMRDVTNVAAEVPGVSTAWVNQTARVSSVNSRTGDVTGVTDTAAVNLGTAAMSTAPIGQWATFSSSGTAGSDWPTALGTAWWNVETFGIANRKTQRATQVYDGAQQGWVFERQLHDTTWGPWQRIITNQSVIAKRVDQTVTTGAVSVNSASGSRHVLILNASTTITPNAPRDAGDELVIHIYNGGAYSFAFAASPSVALPRSVSAPTLAAGEFITLTLLPNIPVNGWVLYIGAKH